MQSFLTQLGFVLQSAMAWKTRAQLYEGRITLSNGYIAIQRINNGKTYNVIHQIEIYPMDSVIRSSNNRGQVQSVLTAGFAHLIVNYFFLSYFMWLAKKTLEYIPRQRQTANALC